MASRRRSRGTSTERHNQPRRYSDRRRQSRTFQRKAARDDATPSGPLADAGPRDRCYGRAVDCEVDLPGGRVTPGVVRVGATVRRPTGSHSAFVHDLLALLANAGFEGSPRFHGLDDERREVLDYREGWVPPDLEWRRWDDAQLLAAVRLVRSLHDASAGSVLAGSAEVVCHGDLSPCNFVFVEGQPRYLIDFESGAS